MTAISPELVERMVKLVRALAPEFSSEWNAELHAIAALLPAPVDPDLLEVRAICRDEFSENGPIERLMLQCLKRGRELANDGWIVWRGGKCPVKDGEKSEALLRNGRFLGDAELADWAHYLVECRSSTIDRGTGDIIAYRIVKRADGGV